MCMWGCLDKYIRIATWPPQTKIPGSALANQFDFSSYTLEGKCISCEN